MDIRGNIVRIKLTPEQKKLFQQVAGERGISVSEYISMSCEDMANKSIERNIEKEKIETRINNTELKIQKLRNKLNNKRDENRNEKRGLFQLILRFR